MAESAPPAPAPDAPHQTLVVTRRLLWAFCVGQVGLHSVMSGLRMAVALQALREGFSAVSVGLLLALFAAAPMVLAMQAGRLADRHGYHRPVHIAIACSAGAALLAVASTFTSGPVTFALLCVAAMASGTGANMGMLAIHRTAGSSARNATERMRLFSWLGIAPSFANVIGPVFTGIMIDLGGFGAAYALLFLLSGVAVWGARQVPRMSAPARLQGAAQGGAFELLRQPGMARLLLANWLLSTCWDAHTFVVPIIGHERGFNASTIGLILGSFTLSVTAIRVVIPMVAHRLDEARVLRWAMWGTGLILAAYPFALTPWTMGACSVLLGITLGSSQPVVMSTLHHLTPADRHGQALALRSMAINLSSTAMPLAFGAAGVAFGAAMLFWVVGAGVAAGGWTIRAFPGPGSR